MMKTPSFYFACAFLALSCLLPVSLLAKGGGIGFWMEGTVTDVTTEGDRIKFHLKGQFRFDQYSGGHTPQIIKVDCEKGITAIVHQADPFFAFTPDWGGGSIQGKGGLLRILKAAAERGGIVRFELLEPQITFDARQNITLTDAAVVRATDADLH
jgi:hypothetical protein